MTATSLFQLGALRLHAISCTRWLALALLACADPALERSPSNARDASTGESEVGDAADAEEKPEAAGDEGAEDANASVSPAAPRDAGTPDARAAAQVDAASGDESEPPELARGSLVRPELWKRVGPEEDPFADRPALVLCGGAATMPETLAQEEVFSVDTEGCNYLTATQPTLRAVAAGKTLKVRLWHFELRAPEPAQAHAALFVGDQEVLDEQIAIPQPGGLIVRELLVTRPIPAGAPVYFHLHNHGENSWALVEVSATP